MFAFAFGLLAGTCCYCGESGIRIDWDLSSMRKIAPEGTYPRLIRLHDGSAVAVYEHGGNSEMRTSADGGDTWGEASAIFERQSRPSANGEVRANAANPEIVQLKNGIMLAACNYRPERPGKIPFAIAVSRSADSGKTWSAPEIVHEAGTRFENGCWEPSFLELPNGDVQIYFANEGPYIESSEQEISMLTSKDNGMTWGGLKTASFRRGSRDGMPVAKIVGGEIVCVIEDCGFGAFKPYTVRTKPADNWPEPVWGDSPMRAKALADPVEEWVYMGAPYLAVLPSGETVISYQADRERRGGDRVAHSVMEVAVGDKNARNFSRICRPFPIRQGGRAIWPSLAVWDNDTVVALAACSFNGEATAPYMIKGRVMRDIGVKSAKDALKPARQR